MASDKSSSAPSIDLDLDRDRDRDRDVDSEPDLDRDRDMDLDREPTLDPVVMLLIKSATSEFVASVSVLMVGWFCGFVVPWVVFLFSQAQNLQIFFLWNQIGGVVVVPEYP